MSTKAHKFEKRDQIKLLLGRLSLSSRLEEIWRRTTLLVGSITVDAKHEKRAGHDGGAVDMLQECRPVLRASENIRVRSSGGIWTERAPIERWRPTRCSRR
jgi:hypothetical protein